MPLQPNSLCQSLTESVTLAIAAHARKLKGDGLDVISLSAGEPDFDTIEPVAQAGIEAIRAGDTRYTAAMGKPALREAAAAWFLREHKLHYEAAEVMATAGVKPALAMALMTLVERGDTVLMPAPYWASYPSLVTIAGGVPVDIPAVPEQNFLHTGEQLLAAARESGAKGVMLNFPNNPSGTVPTAAQVEELVQAATEADLWILSDEIYSAMIYEGAEHVSPARFARDRTVIVTGGSKSHSLTGWRIGMLAGPAPIVAAAGKLQSQVLGNPATPSQAAGMEALTGDHSVEIARRVEEFNSRRLYFAAALDELPGVSARTPMGAFYVMLDCREICAHHEIDDVKLAEELLDEELIAVVPGAPFSADGFLRLSYATSQADLERAIERLHRFFSKRTLPA